MWFAIVVFALVWVVIVGYACLCAASDADDRALADYERQRAEFESWFE